MLIFALEDLGDLGADQLHIISEEQESNRLLSQHWRAVEASGNAEMFYDEGRSLSFRFTRMGRFHAGGSHFGRTHIGSGFWEVIRYISLRARFVGRGLRVCQPDGQTGEVRRGRDHHRADFAICPSCRKAQHWRNCDASLRPAASGVRFCNATTPPHFSPSEEGELAWPSFFATGGTFQIYVDRRENACILLGVPTAWKTKAAASAGHGPAKSGDKSLSSRPDMLKGSWFNFCQPKVGATISP